MSVEKKSLISNRKATKKANLAKATKATVTKVGPARLGPITKVESAKILVQRTRW